MRASRLFFVGSLFLLLMEWGGRVWASPDVMPQNLLTGSPLSINEGLEVLRSFGCASSMFTGDGIRTEDEIRRILAEAQDCNVAGDVAPLFQKTLAAFGAQYPKSDEIDWKVLRFSRPVLQGQYFYFKDDRRIIRPSDRIDAVTSPWLSYREGIPYAGGSNGRLAAAFGASVGHWFDVSVAPAFLANQDDSGSVRLHAGVVKLTRGNFEVKAGRTVLLWGQGHDGQVIASSNAPPLDLVEIGNPRPLMLPSFLRYAGPFQYRVIFSRLNQQQAVPDPYFLNARLMAKPTESLELALSRGIMFGGQGSPPYHWWWEPVSELLGIRIQEGFIFNIPIKPRGTGPLGFANNVTALDARWRSAALRGTEFFLEVYEEDPLDFQDFWPQDTIFHGGIWIPRLNAAGDWQLLVDGTRAADIVYSHLIYTSGYTQNGRLIGSDIGFDSREFRILLAKLFLPRVKVWGSFGMRFHMIPTQPLNPIEIRYLVQSGATYNVANHWQVSLQGGLEQIENFNFVDGQEQTSFMSAVDLNYLF